MDDIKKMLSAVMNGQSALKQELLTKIDSLEKRFDVRFKKLEKKVDKGFKEVNKRLDIQGKTLAYLDDDTPNREELDALSQKVEKIEQKFASV